MSPLPVSKYPFIFMNAAKTQTDVKTLLHESGHAVHDILSSKLPYDFFRDYPMEIAEVASMSMELISMEHRGRFYKDESELKRAKREQIEDIIDILPWISIIDSFQYWIYKKPTHTIDERDAKMVELLEIYQPWVDRTDYKSFQKKRRQSQLHIFEVPFYYIEYGIAQLASIGVWKNYLTDPKQALEQYKSALSLGYTRPLPELYATAGISFDFSPTRIQELAEFVQSERAKLID